MTAFISFLVFCQVFGASVGAFTAVWSEIAYVRAIRDGKIDAAEREYLRIIANGLRFGMIIILLSSLCLVIVAYVLNVSLQPALSGSYWALVALAFFIIGASWALSRRRISFSLGSATVFTAWWFLAYLTIGWLPSVSFGSDMTLFVIAVAVFYAILKLARFLVLDGVRRFK